MLGSIYYMTNYNELFLKQALELAALNAKENLSSVETKQKTFLEGNIEVKNKIDRKILSVLFSVCMVGSFFASVLGFNVWFKKVQPKQDE
jgi:uncharacterized membrane protein